MSVEGCLAAVGVAVAVASPMLLARPGLVDRQPRLAVAGWLLTAGSVLGAWLTAGLLMMRHPQPVARGLGTVVVLVLAFRLAWGVADTWRTTRRRRAVHAQALRLLGEPDAALGVVVVESGELAVYCLPGGRGTVVVTTGARAALSPAQLRAVLAHERAHLDGRHHLILSAGQALTRALPYPGLFRLLGPNVAQLLEMIADDAAVRRHGRPTVARALLALGAATAPAGALGVADPSGLSRALRLSADPLPRRARLARVGLPTAVAVLVLGPYLTAFVPLPYFC